MNPRFKIDFGNGSYSPFILYFDRGNRFWSRWTKIEDFKTRDEAVAHYRLIKDLPEYLP